MAAMFNQESILDWRYMENGESVDPDSVYRPNHYYNKYASLDYGKILQDIKEGEKLNG